MAVNNKKDLKESNTSKHLLVGAVGLLGVLILASILILVFSANKPYVAKVGGEKITRGEFNVFLNDEKEYIESLFKESGMDNDTFWSTQIEGETAIELAKRNALESARELKIQYIEAKNAGIKLSKDEIDYVDYLIDSNHIPSEYTRKSEKDEYLKNEIGASYDDFRAVFRQVEVIRKHYAVFSEGIEANDDILKEYYEEDTDRFDTVNVQHILIKADENSTEEEVAAAEALAQDVLSKLNEGQDINTLAEEYNDDGGVDYSFTINDGYVQEFKDWAFSQEEGDTGVVETEFGYHVMKHNGFKKEFDELKDDIKSAYIGEKTEEKYEEQITEWLEKEEYNIVKNDKEYNSIK